MQPSEANAAVEVPKTWGLASLALHMLAIDPGGFGGICVRTRMGPVRQRFDTLLGCIDLPPARLHPGTGDTELFGGLDVAATLAGTEVAYSAGLAETPHALQLTMAERCPRGLAARLAQILDMQKGHCLILLDEGVDDEAAPHCLTERVAFFAPLGDVGFMQTSSQLMGIGGARLLYPTVKIGDDVVLKLTSIAARLGITSLRAPLFAIRAAKAHAALKGRESVTEKDLTVAAALVYPSRAMLDLSDEMEEPEADEPPAPPPGSEADEGQAPDLKDLPDEVLIEAMRALLPDGLLNELRMSKAARMTPTASGAGQRKVGRQRGRPLTARPGKPGGTARLDILATLRAAAPWQVVRNKGVAQKRLQIRPSDLHIKRYEDRSDRVLIFAVDASGSAALARLAEAKGAVELLLADAYASRDNVALIAFRGERADVLLPPTRSLVQTKKRLSALPGGGGTPLASGLQEALTLALAAKGKGMTPTILVLTDGRGNIALDGTPGRAQASEDADKIARVIRASGVATLIIDVAARPRGDLAGLAALAGAKYVPLPRADAQKISTVVSETVDA